MTFKTHFMDVKIVFGTRLKHIRLKKKLTQLQLAERSGIERTFISHIEAGHRNVSIDTMEKLFEGLDVSFKQFFSRDFE